MEQFVQLLMKDCQICHFLNPIACYAVHNILVDSKTLCTKALSPLPYCNADDAYGLDGLFALKMPNPYNEFAEPVSLYYTPLHTNAQSNNVFYPFRVFIGRNDILGDPMSSTTSRRRCSSSTKIAPKPGENSSPSRASPRRLLHLAGDPVLESPIRSLLLQHSLILMYKYASPCLFRARAEFLED